MFLCSDLLCSPRSFCLQWGAPLILATLVMGIIQQKPYEDHTDFVRNPSQLCWELMQRKCVWSPTDLLLCALRQMETDGGWTGSVSACCSGRGKVLLCSMGSGEKGFEQCCVPLSIVLPHMLWELKSFKSQGLFVNVIEKTQPYKVKLRRLCSDTLLYLGTLSWAGY